MARLMLVIALCVLPALVSASRPVANPLSLKGRVYCDTCRAGFETSATTYIHGAQVRVECKDRDSQKLLYTVEATTDSSGTYTITVKEDHKNQLCDAMLISSPQTGCALAAPGRDRARVILTRDNGMVADDRVANAMGFMKDEAIEGCNKILQQYQE
ncbi:hypothetical protein RJ639_038237 [Escallonia herrerae]|uniref:Uncharacterized protein n=1 Tax=Escallonia herrerae TaxID=1293975 RepID=A0AA88X000_9ASTE|nr:hypothetical protein RJ639_038237 [Escallonia herrerae]